MSTTESVTVIEGTSTESSGITGVVSTGAVISGGTVAEVSAGAAGVLSELSPQFTMNNAAARVNALVNFVAVMVYSSEFFGSLMQESS